MSDETIQQKRRAALKAWLEKVGAVFCFQENAAHYGLLRAYQVKGALVIVQDLEELGWDLFVPASLNGSIAETLQAAEKAIGWVE